MSRSSDTIIQSLALHSGGRQQKCKNWAILKPKDEMHSNFVQCHPSGTIPRISAMLSKTFFSLVQVQLGQRFLFTKNIWKWVRVELSIHHNYEGSLIPYLGWPCSSFVIINGIIKNFVGAVVLRHNAENGPQLVIKVTLLLQGNAFLLFNLFSTLFLPLQKREVLQHCHYSLVTNEALRLHFFTSRVWSIFYQAKVISHKVT